MGRFRAQASMSSYIAAKIGLCESALAQDFEFEFRCELSFDNTAKYIYV